MRISIIRTLIAWLVLASSALAATSGPVTRVAIDDHVNVRMAAAQAARAESARSDAAAWTIAAGGVHTIDANGEIRQRVELVASGFGEARSIGVDPYDDSVWVATDASLLLHFAADGSLVQGVSLSTSAIAVAIDLDRSVWLVAGDQLLHFSASGDLLATRALALSRDEAVTGIAADALRDRTWLATTQGAYLVERRTVHEVLRGEALDLALDPRTGNVLAIVDGALVAVIAGDVRPVDALAFVDDDWPVSVAYDADQASFVVDSMRTTLRLDTNGHVIEGGMLEARTALRPFRIEPTIDLLRPPTGGAISESVDEIIVRVGARCGATPCDIPEYAERMLAEAALDGVPLPQLPVGSHGFLRWPVNLDERTNSHRFNARVVDRFGRSSALDEAHWTFVARSGVVDATSSSNPLSASEVQIKAANKPPSVSLTSPQAGALFTAGTNITLTASAADPDGSVAKVEFYRGGTTLIGTTTAAPFQFTWSFVSAGNYLLTAKAYDNRNGTATSSAVSISVLNNQAPQVAVLAPTNGSFVPSATTASIVASASDPDGTVARVEFFDDKTPVGVATSAPFATTWTPNRIGMHTLEARATDDNGASTTSMPVDVIVGAPPVVVVTAPVACSFLDGPLDVMLAADAVSASGSVVNVEFFDNSIPVGTVTSRPWRFTMVNVLPGTHTITARALDDHGLVTTSRPALFTVRAQNIMPSVNLTSPLDGSHVPVGASVTLTANASDSDGTIATVEFRQGGTVISRLTTPPYTTTWKPGVPGTYSLAATAIDDRNGSTTSTAVRLIVDPNVPPSVSLTVPAANASFAAPANIAVQATASDSDGTIAKVEFLANGSLVGTATTSPYTANWSNVAAGTYSLTARATDDAGGVTTSSIVPIVVKANTPPTVTLMPPSTGPYFAPATIGLSASAADSDGSISRVEFYANGALIGTASVAPYAMVWDAVQGGSYVITAKAIDDAGASATSTPANVYVQAAPTLAFDGMLGASAIDDDNVLVSGYVSAPTNSAVTVNGVVTHIDDRGFFQANDVPLAPGTNEIAAVVTSQDGQTITKTVTVESSGPGLFVVRASPTEGLETLKVAFTVENPRSTSFKQVLFDLDNDGYPNLIAYPNQFQGGKLTVTATYPVGTWLATVTFLDDQDRVVYRTQKSIVVLMPQILQGNVRALYENMLLRLRAGKIESALTAFTSSMNDKYREIFTLLQPDLVQIIEQLGTVTEITFNLDMAEIALTRNTAEGSQTFMIYLIRSEDGIWRIDGM